MTAQVADDVELAGQIYSITAVQGGPLFDPGAHRIGPASFSTACYRGYICSYRVDAGSLRLVKLLIGTRSTVNGRTIGPGSSLLGRGLSPESSWSGHSLAADGLDVPIPFTGGLLLGQGLIESTYVHMGFHPAWKFQKVIELLLDQGQLNSTRDRSAELAVYRRSIITGDAPDPDGPGDGIRWVKRTFSLDYFRSLPAHSGKVRHGGRLSWLRS